jgi:uncharacterized membrane protein
MPQRFFSIDVARGLIMIIMALDHCSGSWLLNYRGGEFAFGSNPKFSYEDGYRQISREVTHLCAPGFQLFAGMGLALSVARSRQSGMREGRITDDLLIRAFVLYACEWLLMYYPFGESPFFFLVLSCIASSIALFSLLRFLPSATILVLSAAVMLLGPMYAPNNFAVAGRENFFTNIWTQLAFLPPPNQPFGTKVWGMVLYPILPWVGCFGVGWFLGTKLAEPEPPAWLKRLPWLALGLILLGILARMFLGRYGDRMPGADAGILSREFWLLSKYPPSPAFLFITLGGNLLILSVARRWDTAATPPAWARVVAMFGRVALFYYVVHFYLYGQAHRWAGYMGFHASGSKYSMAATLGVWLAGVVVMWPLCALYDRARQKYRNLLRYF